MKRQLWLVGVAVVLLLAGDARGGSAMLFPLSRQRQTNSSQPVRTGLERLAEANFAPLVGKRVAVITNRTAITPDGDHLVDLVHRHPRVQLVAIFTPEHGFRAVAEGAVGDSRDERTGVPIFSLYGKRRKPTPEQLRGVDALVFDIQDIGCRFYTYISTLGLCMEAASEAGVDFYVLDRPNPIGGVLVEGPVLDAGLESFVGFHTLPIRHGMTVGEIATLYRRERFPRVRLTVIRMSGWRRDMYLDQTGQPWINPSPNMRSLRQAVLYPGIGLLETTNLSVGRGTDTPFERFGAPWLDHRALWRELRRYRLPGVAFVPVTFQPTASKFAGETCRGLEVIVTDRETFRPVRTGLAIAHALRRLHPEDWDYSRYRRLLSDERVMQLLADGASFETIIEHCRREEKEFLTRRRAALLYE